MRRLFEGRLLTQKILDIEASLRPPLSRMARLYYREGLTQSQIARRLGVTQCTASRILAKLHAEVHRRYHRQVRALHRRLPRPPTQK
jgi:DNA-directed RNA polymerase specialized sigma subunit